jgi:hypothetical protein
VNLNWRPVEVMADPTLDHKNAADAILNAFPDPECLDMISGETAAMLVLRALAGCRDLHSGNSGSDGWAISVDDILAVGDELEAREDL